MEIALVVAVGALAAVVIVIGLARHRPGSADTRGAAEEPSGAGRLAGLGPGMLVHYRDEQLVVERTLEFSSGRERWTEHRLSDDRLGRSLWLEIQDHAMTVYERLPLREDPPGVQALERDGLTYRLIEDGRAEYRSHERAGPGKQGLLHWVEYASGRVRLAYECFDEGPWEVSLGHIVEPDDVAAA